MPFEFEVLQNVTVPQLKLTVGVPVFVRFETLPEKAKDLAQRAPNKAKDGEPVKTPMEAPFISQVTNLETGEISSMIVNAVVKAELEDKYKDKYVGKSFRLLMYVIEGKRYKGFEIQEIKPKIAKASVK